MAKSVERIELLPSSPGNARHLVVHRYRPDGHADAGGSLRKVYIQASLHADEIPGMLVAHHLLRRLDAAAATVQGEIVVVPMANPIGLAQNVNAVHSGRYELAGGGNFNRNWPALAAEVGERIGNRLTEDAAANVAAVREAVREILAARPAESELDSLRLALLRLALDADIVLDLHCDEEALLHVFLGEALWPDAADLSAQVGSRATLLANDSGGNPFDECCSGLWWDLRLRYPDRAIPAACLSATVEYRGMADVGDRMAEADADNLFRFLQRRGLLAGDPGPLPQPQCQATPLNGTDVIRTPVAGIVAYKVALGDQVKAGDVVADVVDPAAEHPEAARHPLHSRASGLVLSLGQHKLKRPGETVAKIVGETALPHRTGRLLQD